MQTNNLPPLEVIVLAKCQRSNGDMVHRKIRRIKSKDTHLGWQWSDAEINTYFTLKVISWELSNN